MREIKFRWLSVETGEWVYGSLSMVNTNSQKIGSYAHGQMFICNAQKRWQNLDNGKTFIGDWTEVDAKSVGQFTGLKDKNGVDIYEGDRVKNNDKTFFIKQSKNQHVLILKCENDKGQNWRSLEWLSNVLKYSEITGNIHQSPEIPCK